MQIVGFHGTCVSAAESILKNGFRAKGERQRAGPGVYLWAGPGSLEQRARALSETWYQQKSEDGDYAGEPKKAFALLRAELNVEVEELLDLEQMLHHQGLEALSKRGNSSGRPFADSAALFAAYIAQVATFRADRGHQLKVVRVILPAPQPFKYHSARGLVLTSGVDAYIVQADQKGNVPPCGTVRI